MHRLLKDQLKKHFKDGIPTEFEPVLEALDNAYHQTDVNWDSLKQAFQVIPSELLAQNRILQQDLLTQTQQHISNNQYHQIISATLNASQEGIIVISHDERPVVFNTRYIEMNGLKREDVEAMNHRQLLQASMNGITEPSRLLQQMRSLKNKPGEDKREVYRSHDGHWIEAYACNNPIAGFIWMLRDITEIREKEETIAYQAQHDSLTQLPNRLLMHDRLEQAIQRASRENHRLAVCYLDLDAFKTINDSLGHDAGDQLLIKVSKRLKTRVREADTLARIGGDEFVIIFDAIKNQDEVLYMVERLMLALSEPILLEGRKFFIGTSIGIALFPDNGDNSGLLLRNADIAMYRAKDNGKNRFHFFTPSLERIAQHRMAMETNLRRALDNDELELHYQPKFYLQSSESIQTAGELHSFEALIRWPKSDGSYIPPSSFIHVAEDSGLISRVSQWVLETAAKQAKSWYQKGLKSNISINISAKQFLIPDFEIEIVDTLQRLKIPQDLISIEITESLLMQDLDNARRVLEYFRDNNVFIYLDDFGTGFSSLSYLKNLPIDALKIDRSFVKDLGKSKADQAIASSIIALGKNLDMLIVAEGIETPEQAQLLKDQGCDLAQGYYYGRPVNAGQAERFFRLAKI